ncbi:hypothetical protein [uncultured Pseudoalteromonas sp.]|uniref:hypothetical protein n=1 Tax=uncultured Pseudoalteromonas sp. TaxID=114053 RepID=UPI00259AD0B6|nr:hypothetical protein [uncultured Pseudoalteromonas sp.]
MEEIIKLIIAISLLALTFYVLKKGFVKDDLVYKIMGLIMVIICICAIVAVSLKLVGWN